MKDFCSYPSKKRILLLDTNSRYEIEYNDEWILFKQWVDEGWIRDPVRVSSSPHDNEANNNYKSAPLPPSCDAWSLPARAPGILIRLCLAPGFDIWTFAT